MLTVFSNPSKIATFVLKKENLRDIPLNQTCPTAPALRSLVAIVTQSACKE